MRKLLFILPFMLWLCGCKKNDNQAAVDDQIIQKYISDHHLNAVAEPNGLYYVLTMAGTGGYPVSTSTITITYKGYLTDGTVFDQKASPVSFYLPDLIQGWQEGIPLIGAGGSIVLYLPPTLAYGSSGSGPIPGNANLIFTIDLKAFQ